MSAIVNASGKMMEWVKYSSYGIPFGLPAGDTDSDGDCDQTDINNIDNWVSGYDVRYDLDLDLNWWLCLIITRNQILEDHRQV